MEAMLTAIEYYLPDDVLTNEDLASRFSDWSSRKIEKKVGIRQRHIARADQTSLDLGVQAATLLFERHNIRPSEINFLLFCTQSPDYFLPTTACLAQERLSLPTDCGALDFNLGCSGFVYGLSMAKALVESGQVRNVLLITAETYSKFISPDDRSNLTIFGDGASASLVVGTEESHTHSQPGIGPFIMGTDGRGAENLIVRAGGMRHPINIMDSQISNETPDLYMNGPEIFNFTIQSVPTAVADLLEKSGKAFEEIDLFVFHQANKYMLEYLRDKIGISKDKFVLSMLETGNTVSSTIPIALRNAANQGQLQPGMTVMLVGFGVGYSWAACLVQWFGGELPG